MTSIVPILKLYETLIVRVPAELTDEMLAELKEKVASSLRSAGDIEGLILEVSALEIFDSYVARIVRDLAMTARLMGVRTLLTGLDVGMAITLVEMGLEMQGVETTLNLEAALEAVCPWVARPEDEDEVLPADAAEVFQDGLRD